MYSKSAGSDSPIDTVEVRKVEAEILPGGAQKITAVVVYLNKKSAETYGSCPVTETLMSDKTKKALRDFTESVEEDFGNMVFDHGEGGGTFTEVESNDGLDPESLGGRKWQP